MVPVQTWIELTCIKRNGKNLRRDKHIFWLAPF
jgi:hypothetical protein